MFGGEWRLKLHAPRGNDGCTLYTADPRAGLVIVPGDELRPCMGILFEYVDWCASGCWSGSPISLGKRKSELSP